MWAKTIGGAGQDVGRGVGTDPSGNVFVTGGFTGSMTVGTTTLTAPQTTAIFLAKYSGDGQQVMWAKAFGGNFYGQDIGYGLAVDGNGNVGITGTVESNYIDFGGGPLYGDGTLNMCAAKFSSAGNYVWAKRLKTGATLNYGCAAGFDGSGNLITGGYFAGTVDFGGGLVTGGVSLQNGYLVKYGP